MIFCNLIETVTEVIWDIDIHGNVKDISVTRNLKLKSEP